MYRPNQRHPPCEPGAGTLKAIETIYGGIQFRSRLEARWAAFFDAIGWSWVYEPFDGDYYIPDFLITGDRPMLVEVRPAVTKAEYEAQIQTIKVPEWKGDVLILGASPFPKLSSWKCAVPAGLLGEWAQWSGPSEPGEWSWANAEWHDCLYCGAVAVTHEEQSFACRPCGHHDGDGYLGEPDDRLLNKSWSEACNVTRWNGAA